MNEQALNDAFNLFVQAGYNGDINKFVNLISTNPKALDDAHQLFTQAGYNGDINKFKVLLGIGQQQPAAPKKKEGFGGVLSQPLEAVQEAEQLAQQESVSPSDQSSSVSPSTDWAQVATQGATKPIAPQPKGPVPAEQPKQPMGPVFKEQAIQQPKIEQYQATDEFGIPLKELQVMKPVAREEFLAKPTEELKKEVQVKERLKKIEEETPEFLKPSIQGIKASAGKTTDTFVQDMNYQFGDAGFEFTQKGVGFNIEVKTPDGEIKNIEYNPDSPDQAVTEIQYLIRTKSTGLRNIDKIEKMYKDENKKFSTEYQVEFAIKEQNKEQEELALQTSDFLKRKTEAESSLKSINEMPLNQRPANYRDLKFQAEQNLTRINEEADEIQKRIDLIPIKKKNLETAIGKYNLSQSTQGSWVGQLKNTILTGLGGMVSGLADIGIDIKSNIIPLPTLLGEKNYEQKVRLYSEQLGLDADKVLLSPEYFDKLSDPEKRYAVLKAKEYRQMVEPLIRDEYQKSQKYGTEDEITFMEGARVALRKGFGSKSSTQQWEDLTRKNWLANVVLGGIETLPSMIGPNAWIRRAQAYAVVDDMLNKEFENDPELKNISENEKLFVKVPIGLANAWLEEKGFSNIVKNTALVKSITGRALMKATKGVTPAAFNKLLSNEVSEMITDGVLRVVGGGLIEFETGALQRLNETTTKSIYNLAKGKELFDTPDTILDIASDTAMGGFEEMIGSIAISTPTIIGAAFKDKKINDIPQEYFDVFVSSANDINTEKGFIQDLKSKIISGEMTKQDAVDLLNNYRNSVGLLRSVPPELNNEDKKKAMSLLRERKELEQRKEGKDDALAKPIQAKIDAINEQLTKISEDAIQKQTAGEVSVQPEAGVGEEVVQGEPQPELEVTPEEGVTVQEEGVTVQEEVAPSETRTAEQEADLLEELISGKKKEPVVTEAVVEEVISDEDQKAEIPTIEEVGETELEIKDVETTPEETQKQVEEFDKEKLPEQEKPKAGQVAELAIEEINADPERFQYKEVSDKEAGVTEKFKGEKAPFKKELAGVISVWVDPADGKTYVINGHHRLDFAKRSGEKSMNVIYIDAKNASEARLKGAMQNIAEGMGTDMDAAKIFRETGMTVEQVQASGISVKGAKAMNGLALASLSDNLFNLVAQGKLSQTVGIIIGNTIKNKEVQEQFYNTIKNKNLNNATIKVMAEDIQAAPVETVQMIDLFGETETQQAAYQQRATFIAGIRAIVSKAKNVLGKAAKSASFLEEYGNQIDEVASETGSRESAMALAVFDKLRNTSPEIKQMIDEGVERIKNGENKNKVLNETAKRIIEATPAIVERITGQPVAGRSEAKKPSPKGKQGAKVKGEKLADAIRKNLKVKGPGGLQSNILGVPIAIWNAGVETVAKSIEVGMALNDAVQRGINYIKEKHGKKINEASVEKKMLIGIYSGAIKTAREAGISNDGIKKYLERQGATDAQIEALLKYKEKGEKKAPSAEKIVGKPKPKKVTANEMSALKDQIRLEAKAAREAKGDLNAKRKQLAAAINAMVSSGALTARQAEIIIRRVNLVNLDNPVMVERLLDYAEKVFKDAEYASKLKTAKNLQSTAKSLSKNKEKNAEVRDLAKEFGKIDPSMAENIDEYIEIASEVVEGVKGSRLTSKGVALASAIDINKTKKYIDKALENQNEKQRELMAAKMQELMGVDVSDLSYDQMMELLSDEKPIDKYKEGIIRDTISRMFDTYSAIIESMFKTGKNPFDISEDAETVEFKDSQKELVRNFMSIDLNLLTPREALMAVDALNNFIVNGSTANMETVYRNYTGTKNAKTVKDKGIKGKPLSFLFIKSLGRFFLEEFVSLPLLIESMFKSQATALYFSKMMGLNDLANSASQATSITQIAVSNYLKQFSSLKPNKKAFNDAYNATERGMLAFMTRNIIGTEAEMKKEFEYRKKLLEESIKELSEGSTKEQEKAKLYQQAYDKILKDSKDAQEVKQKTDKINADAVDWWINEWSKHYNDMSDVSLNVYNKVLEKDLNYTTDRYARLEMAPKDKSELESNASAYFFNNGTMYKKEAGALKETVDKTGELPKNKDGEVTRYVDLSFDSVQASSLYDAMSDIKTAGAIRQVESFLKSKDLKKVFTPEDLKLLTDRVNLAIRNIRSQVNYDSSELNKLVKNLDRFAKFSATLALAGVTQPFKQTIPLMFNTLINAGSIDPVSILTNNDLREFINNSGRAIANRGVESQVYIESINRLIDQAAKSTPEKAAKFIEKANDLWMKVFLANPDAYIAKASWIAYYEQSLKKQGLYRESIKPITPSNLMTGATVFDGFSGIDYSTHKLNEEAADYAQMMVDRQQNITDTRLAGAMYSDTKGGAYKKILTRLFLPLASFRLNQYFRTKSDLATLFSKSNTFQDKAKAARSLTGLTVEMLVFKSLVVGFGLTWHYVSDAIIAAFTGEEEDEEEKEKKWKIRRDNLLKGQATSTVTDLFSPLPAFDPLVKYGANTALDVTQELLDVADENKLSIFVDDPKKVKTYSDAAGMYGIGIDKVLEILKTGDLAFSGKHTDNYGNEKFITKEQQELLKWSLIPSLILNTGVIPGAPEFNNIMGKIKKDIMYSGKTKNQLEESAAFRDYGSRKEFEKADKQGYLKAKNTPEDPLYGLNKKEKEEREKKKEEKGEPSGGKVDRGARKLGRGKMQRGNPREFGR